ncbi:MAG: transposase [Chloroflexi bacterium]|nr:transposase [Chloroflexota bacterium]
MSKITRILAKDWDELVSSIPDDLESSAKEYGALRRRRGIKSAANLLRLILIYANVLSLLTTALWGVGLGICNISRQAIQKRVHKSTPWLRYLVTVLLGTLIKIPVNSAGLIKRVILRDASVISRPGSPGTEWRIHLSWSPFSMQPTQVTVTDERAGEGLEDAELQASDLVVADRAHGIWRTIQVALQAMAYFIIRLTWSNLPLLTPNGQSFDLIVWLRDLPETTEYAEITVIATNDPEKRPLRLVVGRLPPDKAEEARERARRQARKNKRQVNPNTLLAAGFCILLTNLPVTAWPISLVLAFYRVRWQIEWCFRRWKSLCNLDKLPAYPAKIAEPVLLAKLIIILLMQRRLGSLPWNDWWAAKEPGPVVSPVVKMVHNHLCEIICPAAVIDQLLENPSLFLRHLRSSRRKRPLQLVDAARRFAKLIPDLTPVPALC